MSCPPTSGDAVMVPGLMPSGDGLPIGHELCPGNTYDGNTVPEVLNRLKERFQLRWLIFVGDCGPFESVAENLEVKDGHPQSPPVRGGGD